MSPQVATSGEINCTREIDIGVPSTCLSTRVIPVQKPDMLAYACTRRVGLDTYTYTAQSAQSAPAAVNNTNPP